MGLLERLGFPTGQATKIIDGHHPAQLHNGGGNSKPDMLPLPEESGRQEHTCRNILVSISGCDLDTELLTIACTLAKTKRAEVYVVYSIEVPRKLAVDADLPEQTAAATRAIEHAVQVAERLKVSIEPEILQSRHFGQSLVDEAEAHDCALLMMGLPYRLGIGGHFELGDHTSYVMKHALCRVWLVRDQRTEASVSDDMNMRPERPDDVSLVR